MKKIENSIFSTSNIQIMEYLIRKLESKEKKVKKINEKIKGKNFQDYFLKNNDEIILLFSDLENDLLQAICAVKALLSENITLILNQKNIQNKKDDSNYLNSEINYNINTQLSPVKEENEDFGIKKNQLSEVKNIIKNMKENKKKLKKVIDIHFLNNDNCIKNKYNTIDNNDCFNNHKDNINLLHKKLGNSFKSKLLDKNCSQEYFENINKLISEKEKIPKSNFYYYKKLSNFKKEKKINPNFKRGEYSSF